MFRFLSDRYPLILQPLREHQRFDNFYLDMNGIIHTCTHPDDSEIAIENLDDMFERIFTFTDALYRIVAPRRLMFLAVDGVAPRAKMNQQRSRRFRSSKDAERAMAELIARGEEVPSGVPFDSNVITPGTYFMLALSTRFRKWIDSKMRTDPAWQQGCSVVFSGSEVPGEGEHKIMDYIRDWRKSPEYSTAIRHCMYGLDADLMMLGLVAHAPHFTLIREKIRYGRGRQRRTPTITGTERDAEEFELLEIALLRDMLFLEFNREDEDEESTGSRRGRSPPRARIAAPRAAATMRSKSGASIDPARIVDDFVFMCMLVGNDFIPHMPHLDISDGAIELMFRVYRRLLPVWGGFLTERHKLHPDRLEHFLRVLAKREPEYFELRARTDGVPEYATERYREAYYREKFSIDVNAPDCEAQLDRLRRIYMEGLHWVLQYYHNGVSSWNWFYPDFYAPLASDMAALRSVPVHFKRGRPFAPLTQLMAVLPPGSASCLPEPMQQLMLRQDSPVCDFYPEDFETDLNGKRNSWEAVVIVPFIDENRLLNEVSKIDMTSLTADERKRNEFGKEIVFNARDYPVAESPIVPVRSSRFRPRSESTRTRSPRGSRRNASAMQPRGNATGRSTRSSSNSSWTKDGSGNRAQQSDRGRGGGGGGSDGGKQKDEGSKFGTSNRFDGLTDVTDD